MVDDVARRYGRTPDRLLADTGYETCDDIEALAAHAAGPVMVFTPPPVEHDDVKPHRSSGAKESASSSPTASRRGASAWRARAGQTVYALRNRIERINAGRKNHGFGFIPFAVWSRPKPLR